MLFGPSKTELLAVIPFFASEAARMPLAAAKPACVGLHCVPNMERRPFTLVATMPMALIICSSLSSRTRPMAAAAPKTLVVPVMCHPIS